MTSVIQCVVLSSSSPGKPVNPQSISWPLKFSPKKYIQLVVCPHFPQDVLNWRISNHFLIVVQIFSFSLKSKFSFCANAQVFHTSCVSNCLFLHIPTNPGYLFLITVNLVGRKLYFSVACVSSMDNSLENLFICICFLFSLSRNVDYAFYYLKPVVFNLPNAVAL